MLKNGKRNRSGRFNVVKRIKSRRKSTSSSVNEAEELILKNVELDSPSSAITLDVLGRESISTLDTEREDDFEQNSIADTQEEQEGTVSTPAAPQQVAERTVSIQTWLNDVDAVVHSQEMTTLVATSGALVVSAAKTVVHVAALPVTLPLHVATSTTGMVVGTCAFAIEHVCSTVDRAIQDAQQDEGARQSSNPVENFVRTIVPVLFGAVGKLKNDLGSSIMGVVAPPEASSSSSITEKDVKTPGRRNRRQKPESPQEQEQFLERLRLDSPPKKSQDTPPKTAGQEKPPLPRVVTPPDVSKLLERQEVRDTLRSPDVSKFLLRVCDLDITMRKATDARHEKVYHIDLSKEFYDKALAAQAIDSLVENGLALLSSCQSWKLAGSTRSIQVTTTSEPLVEWKNEGSTSKLLKKKEKLSDDEWVAMMGKEVLVWSGKLRTKNVRKADVPVFLSRGMVPVSPRGMLQLFWDDSKTKSYNKFSLGRSTSREIQDDLHADNVRATKIVQSETQVPFTSFSVVMSTLMHARQIDDQEETCFVIVSRSLNPGRAGSHVGSPSSSIEDSKNELLWGVNVIKSVPGHPNVTDLTSVSQVSSSLVVHFLSHKVGLMAVESCYGAMRGQAKVDSNNA